MRLISKVIVGAAVASACGYAAAATIAKDTGTAVTAYSLQSLQITPAATQINLGSANILLGQAYVLNDTLELSATGGSFGSADRHTSTFTCANGAGNSVVFNIVSSSTSASLVTYVSLTPAGVTPGQSCVIPTLMFSASSLAQAGDISVSSISKKAATLASFDTGAAGKLGSVQSEFTVAGTSALDAVIDVQSGRITFASNTENPAANGFNSADQFSFSINRVAGLTAPTAITGTMVLTLTAGSSFGYLADPGDGSCSVAAGNGQAGATAVGLSGATTVSVSPTSGTCNVLTVTTSTVAAGLYTVALGRTANATAAVSTPYTQQGYTASVALTSGATSLASGTPTAGSWSINGTTVNIPYVPVGAANLQVFVANRSSQTGAVNFTAWNASGTSCTGTLGTIDSNANGSYGTALKNALVGCTGNGWAGSSTGRATVQIVTPTPSTSTTVHSAFSVSDTVSRGIVINDTNGK